MAKEVFMPKSGMDMQEGRIIRWLVKEGDRVREGDVLLEIETDKVAMEVEAPCDGILLRRFFDDGAVVPVVTIIAYIGEEGEEVPDKPSMAGGRERAEEAAFLTKGAPLPKREYEYQLAIIGGGPAGYTAALRAARLGAKTVLFEKDLMGGTCTNRGCIPMKSYLSAVRLKDELTGASKREIFPFEEKIRICFEKLFSEKEKTVSELRGNVEMLLGKANVEIVREEAVMIGRHHIKAGNRTYRAANTILATGAGTRKLSVPGSDIEGILDSEDMLKLKDVPESLIVIGGGVIGCEMAEAWQAFGSDVTIVEEREHLLPTFDEDVSKEIEKCLKRRGVKMELNAKVSHFKEQDGRPVLVLKDGSEMPAEKILCAVGRTPDLSCLGVLTDKLDYERGKIMVDEYCRTNIDNIYACGDITNRSILAHSAMKMGDAAASTACGRPKMVRLNRAPLLLFTVPEAAGIGMTEPEARRQGDILVGRYPFYANGRAKAQGETEGFVKVIADKGYGEILGVHIVGPMATELIVEAKTMMDMEITVYEVAEIMHPHPTWSEAFMEACAAAIGECLEMP